MYKIIRQYGLKPHGCTIAGGLEKVEVIYLFIYLKFYYEIAIWIHNDTSKIRSTETLRIKTLIMGLQQIIPNYTNTLKNTLQIKYIKKYKTKYKIIANC